MSDETPVKIILCIPGPWEDQSQFVRDIATLSDGYLFAGLIMMRMSDNAVVEVQLEPPDEQVTRALEIAGRGQLSTDDMRAVAEHRSVAYIVADGGSLENARTAAEMGAALLRSGGLAVKIETAGTARSKDYWLELAKSPDDESLRVAYYTLIGGDGSFYSCGLHNIGQPDVVMEGEADSHAAAVAMDALSGYLLHQAPSIGDGHTFSAAEDAPRYRLHHGPCEEFPPDDPFHNPFGVWRLTPVT